MGCPSPPPSHPQNAGELSVLGGGGGAFLEEGIQEGGGGRGGA